MAERDTSPASGPVVLRPLVDFLHTEAAGGIVLLAATAVALLWANSPFQDSYTELWHTHLSISLGDHTLDMDLQEWVNDGLMTVFFFVVGLEIKRELVEGELREPRRAAMPAIAALGGMVVPALIYTAVNLGGDGADGWGIPMATDIAMAVGVLSLLSRRVPSSLKLFLLALAIVDDIGAIVVIAVFYSSGIEPAALGLAALLVVVVAVTRWAGVRHLGVYLVLGLALWLAVEESGVHATLVGVVLGLMAPTRPIRQRQLIDADALTDLSSAGAAHETAVMARRVRLGGGVAGAPPPPVDELRHPSALRAGQRRHPAVQRGAVRRRVIPDHARRGARPRRRQARGRHGVHVARRAAGPRRVARGCDVAGHRGRRRAGRHRLHRVDLHHQPGLHGPRMQNEAKVGILVASVLAAGVGSLILAPFRRAPRTRRVRPRPDARLAAQLVAVAVADEKRAWCVRAVDSARAAAASSSMARSHRARWIQP